MSEIEEEKTFRKLIKRIAKATLATAIVGAFWLFLWILLSVFAVFPEYLTFFAILAWATLFFTFAIRVSEDTIYKYCFIIARAFFLIIYLAYATNCGILTLNFMDFQLTVEFVPLLALMIAINLLAIARGLLQAIEFVSQSPKD